MTVTADEEFLGGRMAVPVVIDEVVLGARMDVTNCFR